MPDIVTNVLYAEIDRLLARVKELEEELDYERSRAVKAWELHQKCHDVMEPEIEELEAALTEERQRNRLTESIIRENEILTKRVMDLEADMREIGVRE
jgi:hypothetical protein